MPAPDASFPFRIDFPPTLPISSRAEEIVAAIQEHSVIILAGETGSGKTTQIPKMCLAAGRGRQGRIACTQPRRVAALSISRRVADELDVTWGREVGCKVRFNDQTTSATIVKFLTDGMLLAEVQGDPLLREYDTIIIDEAHERSLNIDFLLGHLRTLRYKRPELKIIVTSATIDTEAFSVAFDDAPVIKVEGRTFPVEVIYAPLDALGSDTTEGDEREAKAEALHYIDGAAEAIERIVRESTSGDLLVFMPSERDIRETSELLEGRRLRDCEIIPLFGRLSNSEQQRVFAPTQRRKIVIATNIAETSLTIPGIRFVVDTGLARVSRYSPQSRTRRLPIEPISQSSADQRKGRSGRVAEGVCIRLYSEKDFLERPRFTQPEIQRANLADVILRMKAFGLGDIERFPFLNMPATKSIRAGYALLEELGAWEERDEGEGQKPEARSQRPEAGAQGSKESAQRTGASDVASGIRPLGSGLSHLPSGLTAIGRELARLPVDPTIGRMILQARTEKALREVLVIAAGLSIQDPRDRPLDKQQQADAAHRRFVHPDSDFLTLLKIWEAYHDQFENLSQARLRRFCRDHFLSYTRMREWRDIHVQLFDVLRERSDFKESSVFDGLMQRDEGEDRGKPRGAESARSGISLENQVGQSAGKSRGNDASVTRPSPSSHPRGADPLAFTTPAYRAIHRSILAGLLGNIAQLDEQNGGYKATHDRRVSLFPGSALFRREDPKKQSDKAAGSGAGAGRDKKLPRWIMAGEIMETTRLYARTCARLDPAWALDLGAHLVRVAHSEPFWDEVQGRVLVKQRTRLYGLELESRSVSYGKVNPTHATEIFIREGLVNDTLTWPFDFLANNRKVREEIEDLLTRARDSGYLNLDEAAYRFYAERLMPEKVGARVPTRPGLDGAQPRAVGDNRPHLQPPGISSSAELVDLVRERRGAEPRFLMMAADDLRDPATIAHDAEAFPGELPIENRALPLQYAYKPGQAEDGVTLDVSVREAEALTPVAIDWAVPGHLEAKVEHYLRALPKELRRAFVPLAETAKSVAVQVAQRDRLTGRRELVTEALAAQLRERFRIGIEPSIWADKPLPDHLRVRIRVLDDAGRELCAGRSLAEIQTALTAHLRDASTKIAKADPEGWQRARQQWEKPPQTAWTFGDLPRRVQVSERAGVAVFAFPGLQPESGGVALRLFKTPEEAASVSRRGLSALIELQLRYDLGWLERDLRALRDLGALIATLAPLPELQAQALESIRRWVTNSSRVMTKAEDAVFVSAAAFGAALERAKADLRGLVPRVMDLLREILELRQSLLVHAQPYPGLEKDLAALLPADFLRQTPYAQLAQFPRYLKALKLRAERWRQNPTKDAERAKQLAPYAAAVAQKLKMEPRLSGRGTGDREVAAPSESTATEQSFRWLVEEFRVSLFAQELGTAEPVSTVKLDRALADAGFVRGPADKKPVEKTEKPRTDVVLPLTEKKPGAVKSLGALDRLFPR